MASWNAPDLPLPYRSTPIVWLEHGVPLLEDGHGPRIVGLARETILGKRLLRELEGRGKAARRVNGSNGAAH